MKRILSIVLVLCLTLAALPAFAIETKAPAQKTVNNGDIVIDEDSTGGYTGDYVVIYNPSTSSSTSYSTGTMTGLIETSVASATASVNSIGALPKNYIIDVDAKLAREAKTAVANPAPADTKASYSVGSTKTFSIYSSYSPTGSSSLQFKVLAVGEHCYIWTPTSTNSNVHPINTTIAETCAAEFDSKFDLMQSSFGNHTNGTSGDGKLHMLYYNIDDGWSGSGGYIAGFFYSPDISNNGVPILNIDTYPAISTTSDMPDDADPSRTFGTMVHEYQHLINYSVSSGKVGTWLNESMSAAAEEICYPGSSVFYRIQSWEDHSYTSVSELNNPPTEFAYNSSFSLHTGFSMYNWDNSLEMDDTLALYGQVSLYSQYLYSRYGNTVFKSLLSSMASGTAFATAFKSVTGDDASEVTKNFRIALVANNPEYNNGIYGFKMQESYDPADYYNVENLYNMLGPVVFTGTSCSIKGGGAIVVKPVNGVYNPPSGASSSLKYYGITLNNEPVAVTDIALSKDAVEVMVDSSSGISVTTTPYSASDYTVAWSIADTSIASVSGNGSSASITGIAAGTTTVTAVVTDNVSGNTFTKSATVTVSSFVGWVKTTTLAAGETYIIVSNGTGQAVSNNIVTNNHYLAGVSVTVNDDDTLTIDSSVNVSEISWVSGGNSSSGWTFRSVDDGTYMGLDSSEYIAPSSTSVAWLYDSNYYLNNQIDSAGYYYLSYDSTNSRYTTSKNGSVIDFYKYVSAEPVSTPTPAPTATPTAAPTATPTAAPTATPTAAPTATPTAAPTATPTAAPTATPTAAPTAEPTAEPVADTWVKVDSLTAGGTYIIIDSGCSYAVSNNTVSSGRYLAPVAVTVNSDGTLTIGSSVDVDSISWVVGGSSSGWTFKSVGSGLYMGLDSSEYLSVVSNAHEWVITSEGYLDNQTDSAAYYYLSYSSSGTSRYTTSKSSTSLNAISFYKLVSATEPDPTAEPNPTVEPTVAPTAAPVAQDMYVPVDTIDTTGTYMIGFVVGDEVYVIMNYNPSGSGNSNYYYSYSYNYYGYTAKAVMDGENIVGVEGRVTDPAYCTWTFSSTTGGRIKSTYNSRYLVAYSSSSYSDLYPGTSSSYSNWVYSATNHTLSYKVSTSVTKYATYKASAGSYSNLCYAPTSATTNSYVQIYKYVPASSASVVEAPLFSSMNMTAVITKNSIAF